MSDDTVDGEALPAEEPFEDPEAAGDEHEGLVETLVDRMRGTGVGLEDPNIVGDAGPTDVAPGRDPDSVWPPPDIGPEAEPDPRP